MQWTIRYNEQAVKKTKKLDATVKRRIKKFLDQRLATQDDPRALGTQLVGNTEIWRYRVGDYRILCELRESEIVILVIDIDHRSKIYRK